MVSVRKILWSMRHPRGAYREVCEVRQQRAIRHVVHDEPYMPRASVEGLRRRLEGARLMIEYGSGGSTMLAARLGVEVVSIEGDHSFADAVTRALAERKLAGARVLKANLGWTREWSFPIDAYPSAGNLRRWTRYVAMPWEVVGSRQPDLVLVDGRFRKACVARAAMECLDRGGGFPIIVDDYGDRPHYGEMLEVSELVEMWDRTAVLAPRRDVDRAAMQAAFDRWIREPG